MKLYVKPGGNEADGLTILSFQSYTEKADLLSSG
jgi:hypothetical protein